MWSPRKGGWSLTGPTALVAPVRSERGRVLAYAGVSTGPNGELPTAICPCDVLLELLEEEELPELQVLARGPLAGDPVLAGRVLALPTVMLGLLGLVPPR